MTVPFTVMGNLGGECLEEEDQALKSNHVFEAHCRVRREAVGQLGLHLTDRRDELRIGCDSMRMGLNRRAHCRNPESPKITGHV